MYIVCVRTQYRAKESSSAAGPSNTKKNTGDYSYTYVNVLRDFSCRC